MKNIYDVLNDTGTTSENYPVESLTKSEKSAMKRRFHKSTGVSGSRTSFRWTAAAACAVCVIGLSQTAFAQNVMNGLIQSIHLEGGTTIVQVDPSQAPQSSAQYYNKDGNPIDPTMQAGGQAEIYDVDGNRIGVIGQKESGEVGTIQIKDWDQVAGKLSFSAMKPGALPDGFVFDHASIFMDDGKVSGDYINIIYKNGDQTIALMERRLTSDTVYVEATDGSVEEVTINGHKAALQDGSIVWDAEGVNMNLTSSSLSPDELLSLAKSIK